MTRYSTDREAIAREITPALGGDADDHCDVRSIFVATSGGIALTDDLIFTLAAEAEAGFDTERLQPRPCPMCGSTAPDPHMFHGGAR